MRVSVTRKNIHFLPDSSRVITRFFMSGEDRAIKLLSRIQAMDEV
ncbi:MAG: hypothetical protein ACI9GZ_001325 [Bacteroidia bacterium]|jgi:hypothetical protein